MTHEEAKGIIEQARRYWGALPPQTERLVAAAEFYAQGPLGDVAQERVRQDAKWGEQNHDDGYWLMILQEELGEVAREMMDGTPERAREELVQAAAVIVAWLEAMDRREAG